MDSPPKGKPGELSSNTGRKLITAAHYAVLVLLAKIFGAPFWYFAQLRSRVADSPRQ